MTRGLSVKFAVIILAGVVVVGGGITFWAKGLSQGSKAHYDQLALEVPEEGELRKMVEDSQLKVDDYRTQLQHLEQSVPNLAYVPTLLTELENLGKAHNITVTGVRPVIEPKVQKNTDDKVSGSGSKKAAYREMAIDITGRGNYGNVMAMVEAIKKFPKIIAIQTVGLTPKRETDEDRAAGQTGVVLDATVRIKAYLFPNQQASLSSGENGASS